MGRPDGDHIAIVCGRDIVDALRGKGHADFAPRRAGTPEGNRLILFEGPDMPKQLVA